jgi:hypothetical protein
MKRVDSGQRTVDSGWRRMRLAGERGSGQRLVVSCQCRMPAMRPNQTGSNQIKPSAMGKVAIGEWPMASQAQSNRVKLGRENWETVAKRRTMRRSSCGSATFAIFCAIRFPMPGLRIKPNQTISNLGRWVGRGEWTVVSGEWLVLRARYTAQSKSKPVGRVGRVQSNGCWIAWGLLFVCFGAGLVNQWHDVK